MSNQKNERTAILTLRGALVLTLAVLTGIGIGLLTFLSTRGAAQAVIAGLTAAGTSLFLYDRLVGDR